MPSYEAEARRVPEGVKTMEVMSFRSVTGRCLQTRGSDSSSHLPPPPPPPPVELDEEDGGLSSHRRTVASPAPVATFPFPSGFHAQTKTSPECSFERWTMSSPLISGMDAIRAE